MKHCMAKYGENGEVYIESWLQINVLGMPHCFWRKRIHTQSYNEILTIIKDVMKNKNITCNQLSKQIGKPKKYIQCVLNGEKTMNIELMDKILSFLGLNFILAVGRK